MSPRISARIRQLRSAGRSRAEIVRALLDEGLAKSTPTAYRWIRACPDDSPALHYQGIESPPRSPEPPAPPADVVPPAPTGPTEAELAAALEGDDLAELARVRVVIARAMRQWEGELAHHGGATLTYGRLAKALGDVSKVIADIRPREDVDAERFASLGQAARDELVKRAQQAASPDEVSALRVRVRAQADAIERLTAGAGHAAG